MDQHVIIDNIENVAFQALADVLHENKAVSIILQYEEKTFDGLLEIVADESFSHYNKYIGVCKICELPHHNNDKEAYGLAYMFVLPEPSYDREKIQKAISEVFDIESIRRSKVEAVWY